MLVKEFLNLVEYANKELKVFIDNKNCDVFSDCGHDVSFEVLWDSKTTASIQDVINVINNKNLCEDDELIIWDSDDGNCESIEVFELNNDGLFLE